MRCPACDAESPPAAKFCMGCGAALAATCATCGHPNPPGARFCTECGGPLAASARPVPPADQPSASPRSYTPKHLAEKILQSRAALEGERKQVTALFADVVGSTELAERLDPEDVQTLMRRCFDLMLEQVHRYEGTVAQFTGDGILALFGAPIAHEDHAQRAVRAALAIQHALRAYRRELQEQHGLDFQMRIGLNSGPVVVGTIGTDLNMTYTALGDTVNLAERVQGLAEPGSVVISQQTQRLVGGYFVTRDLGEHRVKGKAEAVGVHEVLRPSRWRSRLDVYAEHGLSPLIGRERDLETLREKFKLARAGQGQVVLVSGDPGIGKSRLLYELKRRLEGEALTWLEGRCIAYGRDTPYLPLIDILKASFEIAEADGEAAIVRKLERATMAMGGAVVAGLPYLKFLLSVDPGDAAVASMDAQLRKACSFEALRTLTLAGAAIRSLVLVVEDLHWIDRLSEEFLSYLADVLPEHPILLLLTYRPGYEHPFGERPHVVEVRLSNLSAPETAALAEGMLDVERLPEELQRLIAARAEGNPFFVEEIVKSLLEAGAIRREDSRYVLAKPVAEIHVPDTIQDVIMARLDRLEEEPKRALQTAAVIGREFAVRLLERTAELQGRTEAYLRELKAVELVFERSLYPELAYMFKHALTHDVAYQSLLVARRKALHRVVGEAIEALYADRLAEQYETLAHHYERAEAWDKALEYLQKSGDKALAAFAPQQAISFYDRAIAVVERSERDLAPERAIGLHYSRGQALMLTSDWGRSAESFQGMLRAAQQAGDASQEGLALNQLSLVYLWGHRFEDALERAEQGRQLALAIDDPAILAGSLLISGYVPAVTGRLKEARQVLGEMLEATRRAANPIMSGLGHYVLGQIDRWQGDAAGALVHLDEGLQIGRRHQVSMALLRGLWFEGLAHCGRGDYEQAFGSLREAFELSARLGERDNRCRVLNSLGWVYMDLCNWDLAIQHNAQSAAEARALGNPEIIRNAELNLADCCLALGRLDEAQQYLETVERESRQRGTWGEEWMKWRYTQHLHASLGELWLARGDVAKAIAFADQCLAAAEATTSRRNIVKGRRLKGEAFLAQGKLDEAETELGEALSVARYVGNPFQLWKTLAALARLREAQGREDDAVAAYREALDVVERVAANLSDAALRETFLGSPQVTAIRAAAGVR